MPAREANNNSARPVLTHPTVVDDGSVSVIADLISVFHVTICVYS